jgi:hypothetical protein
MLAAEWRQKFPDLIDSRESGARLHTIQHIVESGFRSINPFI